MKAIAATALLALLVTLGTASDVAAVEADMKMPPAQSATAAGDRITPAAFRAAIDRVRPSLVIIETVAGVTPGRAAGIRNPGEGPTTGLIVSADGLVITSTFNLIRKPRVITVVLADKSRHIATMLGRDETRNICLLKLDNVHDLAVPRFAPRGELKTGQWAISIGVGYGDAEPAVSAGIISALSRIGGRAVQTDANISPANYGGPLVDIEGRVIGICVPLAPGGRNVAAGTDWYDSGIGFAVSLDGAEKLLADLRAGKVVQPGQLGVQMRPTQDQTPGGVIAEVAKESPAGKAGLRAGDRIVSLDGKTVTDTAHLRSLLGRHVAGEKVALEILRDGSKQKMEIELAVVEPAAPKPPPAPKPAGAPKSPGPKPPAP